MEGKRREEDRQGPREESGGGATQKNGGRAGGIKREEGRVGRGWDGGGEEKGRDEGSTCQSEPDGCSPASTFKKMIVRNFTFIIASNLYK